MGGLRSSLEKVNAARGPAIAYAIVPLEKGPHRMFESVDLMLAEWFAKLPPRRGPPWQVELQFLDRIGP